MTIREEKVDVKHVKDVVKYWKGYREYDGVFGGEHIQRLSFYSIYESEDEIFEISKKGHIISVEKKQEEPKDFTNAYCVYLGDLYNKGQIISMYAKAKRKQGVLENKLIKLIKDLNKLHDSIDYSMDEGEIASILKGIIEEYK